MTNIINFSTVSAVAVLSMGLALLIEVALLKVVFSCLARVKTAAIENDAAAIPSRHWVKQSIVNDLRDAGM
jgi:hypothetical protein